MYVTRDKRKLFTVIRKLSGPPLRINSGNIQRRAQLSPLAKVLAEVSDLIHVFTNVVTLCGVSKVPESSRTFRLVNARYNKTFFGLCCLAQVAPEHPVAQPVPLDNRRLCTSSCLSAMHSDVPTPNMSAGKDHICSVGMR